MHWQFIYVSSQDKNKSDYNFIVWIFWILDKQKNLQLVYAYGSTENTIALAQKHRTPRTDLPTYSMEEVGKHASR